MFSTYQHAYFSEFAKRDTGRLQNIVQALLLSIPEVLPKSQLPGKVTQYFVVRTTLTQTGNLLLKQETSVQIKEKCHTSIC